MGIIWTVPSSLAWNWYKHMIRNLSSTLVTTAEPTAKTTAVQPESLGSPAKVILDDKIALNYLLANKAEICAIANTSCCTWIKTSGIAETQTSN